MTGEVSQVTRSGSAGGAPYTRWMSYDSFGRLVQNTEPNTSIPNDDPSLVKSWRYAYNRDGDLVGTSDAPWPSHDFYSGSTSPATTAKAGCKGAYATASEPSLPHCIGTNARSVATSTSRDIGFLISASAPWQAGSSSVRTSPVISTTGTSASAGSFRRISKN